MLGIEKIKTAVKFAVAFKNQAKESLADGFQTMDLFGFVDELSQLPEVIKSASEMKAELNDLDLSERKELADFVKNELKVEDPNIEQVIVDSMDWVFATYKLVGDVINK